MGDSMSSANLLKNIYLFKDLDAAELEKVSKAGEEKSYTAGSEIFSKGDKAHSLYVIRLGSVKIYNTTKAGDESKIANLGTGSHFGEMPFLDGENRSAVAQAMEATNLLEINYDKLRDVMLQNPVISLKIYKALANYLCGRLRVTTQDLNYARETNLKYF
jgi:CRP/FNR family transcriptional regulator, cyclic AMP receptor protein